MMPAVGDSPTFISALADVVLRSMNETNHSFARQEQSPDIAACILCDLCARLCRSSAK